MIQVLFDISVLGFGMISPQVRTGVYQVVENLARGLAAAPDITVSFCAPATLLHHLLARRWLSENGHERLAATTGARDLPAPLPPVIRLLDILYSRIIGRGQARTPDGSLPRRWQDLLTGVNRLSTAVASRFFPDLLLASERIATADIYHSPFHPFPDHARQVGGGCRFVLTVHDLIPIKFPEYFSGKNTRALTTTLAALTPKDWVLCVSESTRRDLLEYRPDLAPERILVAHLAAAPRFAPCQDDTRLRAVRQRYGIPGDVPYVLGLGTLEPRKNVTATIRAFLALVEQEKIDDMHLVLAGPLGWGYEEIHAAARQSEAVRQRTIFTGYVDDTDLPALYSGALAFVYPSRYEGFGLPVLEAMACGVPVITSSSSSLPEVVGDAGILVDPDDIDGLAEAMRRLSQDEDFRHRLGKRSLRRAAQFSWDKTVRQTIECYRRALSEKSG